LAKRILVVDDEIRVLAVIQRRLESVGYEVITAADGNQALRKARSVKPDLIVLDVILPGFNGYQICGMLKRDLQHRFTPILMLSARSQEKDVEEGKHMGADAYITKPYKHEELVAKIAELLAAAEESAKQRKEAEAAAIAAAAEAAASEAGVKS
jgi:DNA-binding response OmpR family regulator